MFESSSKVLAAVFLIWLCAWGVASAHPSLYHQIEINLHDPIAVRLYLTVHTPELPSAIAAGVDPVAGDLVWLRSRSDEELHKLIGEGESLLREIFSFGLSRGKSDEVVKPLSLGLGFETPAQIRDPSHDNGLPEGCFLATAEFINPGAGHELVIEYGGRGDKRLMILISRPAAFPEVKDLAPGESARVTLPERPPEKAGEGWRFVLLGFGAVLVFAIIAGRAIRLRRFGSQD